MKPVEEEAKTAEQINMDRVIEKVQRLLNLAAKNPNEHEAAAAAAKAQELLTAYNLDMTVLEQGNSGSGKREDARIRGGMYQYERELWGQIARLNFCYYFVTRERNKEKYRGRSWSFKHRLVGRVVNTTATKVMGEYIQGTIERLCRERFPSASQFFSREAVAYREGMADAVWYKLDAKRREMKAAEKKRHDKAEADRVRAARAGVSLATTLTIADVVKSEEAANYDFLYGEGAWARKEQRNAEYEKEDSERRAAQAAADKAAEEAYTQWAAANPEEAAKEAAKERAKEKAKERARERRGSSYRYRAPTAREARQSSSYFAQGYDRGQDISIDQQMKDRGETRRLK
jgi:hypothetical protein